MIFLLKKHFKIKTKKGNLMGDQTPFNMELKTIIY